MGSTTISIFVVSRYEKDQSRILTALSEQENFFIAGVEKDEANAIIKSEKLKPDVLIIDIKPSGMDELEYASIIHRRTPSTSIVLMCEKNRHFNAGKALDSGVMGVLLKEADTDEIMIAAKAVNKGGLYMSAPCIEPAKKPPISPALSFSPAERGIVTHIAQGYSDMEIARYLNFSTGTVKNYLTAIKRKTKLNNRTQIVLFSLVYGLISMELLDIFKTDRQIPCDS